MELLALVLIYIYAIQILVYKRGIIGCQSEKGNTKVFLTLTMGLLLVLNCLRSIETGNDTASYYALFAHYAGEWADYSPAALLWMDSYIDVGYRWINRFFLIFSTNYQLFISCIAIFLYATTTLFIKRYSPNPTISVYLFFLLFFHVYLNVLRQALAIVFVLIGSQFLFKKRTKCFILYVTIATLFHKTAILSFLLIPIAYKKHVSLSKSLFVIVISCALTFSGVINRILEIFGYSGKYISEESGASVFADMLLSSLILGAMLFLKRKVINKEDALDGGEDLFARFYIRLPIVQLIISIVSLTLPILYRCEYYFTIFYITGIPYYLMNNTDIKSNRRIIGRLILLTYIVYISGILYFRPEWYSEFDYHFFWSSQF